MNSFAMIFGHCVWIPPSPKAALIALNLFFGIGINCEPDNDAGEATCPKSSEYFSQLAVSNTLTTDITSPYSSSKRSYEGKRRRSRGGARCGAAFAAPHDGWRWAVPVRRRRGERRHHLVPRPEPPPLQRQRLQHLPPRLDQVRVRRVPGLDYDPPLGVPQGELAARRSCGATREVVHHRVDPPDVRRGPRASTLARGSRPSPPRCFSRRQHVNRLPGGRAEGPEEGPAPLPPRPVSVSRLARPAGLRRPSGPAPARPGRAAGRGRSWVDGRAHLVEADVKGRTLGWLGVERLDSPLIWALKSSVTSSRDALSRCKRVVDRSWICPRLSPLAPMRSTAPHHLISGRDRVPDQHPACTGNGLRGGRDQSFERHGRARGRNAVTRPSRTSPRGRAMCR